jgi:hypothetical protein
MTSAPSNVLPDHVLAAVLALAKKKSGLDRFAFRGHDYQLQEVFFDLSKPGKVPDPKGVRVLQHRARTVQPGS